MVQIEISGGQFCMNQMSRLKLMQRTRLKRDLNKLPYFIIIAIPARGQNAALQGQK